MKKRIFAALLLALLLALGASAQALADEPEAAETPDAPPSGGVFQNGSFSGPQTIPGEPMAVAEDSWKAGLYAAVLNAWRAGETSVNVEPLKIPSAERNALWDVLRAVLNDNPELFYASWYTSKDIYYYPNGPLLGSLTLLYNDTYQDSAVRTQAIREFNEAANRAVTQTNGLTDPVEIALVLHDWLVTNCEYNWTVATVGGKPGNSSDPYVRSGMPWNAYGALVKGDAVCQGYALAYKYLLGLKGIDSMLVTASETMNHAWNGVLINGKWYHVDVTWDDPAPPDKAGYCGHTYFLLSDTSFPNSDHHGWDKTAFPFSCDDTTYTSGYAFNSSHLPFYRWNGNFYYVKPLASDEWKNAVYRTTRLDQEGRQLSGDLGLTAYSGAAWVEGRLYLVPSAYSNGPDQRVLMVYDLDAEIAAQAGLFPYVPSDSPDDKVDKSNDRNPGVRYNEGTGEIEIVSPTRRQVVYSVPAASLSSGWSSAQAGTSGAGVAPGLSPDGAAAVLWGSGSSLPSGLTLWAAFYNGSGKLLKYQMIDSAAIARANISNVRPGMVLAYLDPPSGYASVKLMLLTADRAPLCAAG